MIVEQFIILAYLLVGAWLSGAVVHHDDGVPLRLWEAACITVVVTLLFPLLFVWWRIAMARRKAAQQ